MKIRKFQGKNLKEVMDKVKKALGPDALILSVEKHGLINKYIEVTAAVDESFEKEEKDEKVTDLSIIQDEIKEIKEIIRSFIPANTLSEGVFPFFQQVRKRGISEEIAMKLIAALEEGILKEGLERNITIKDLLYELLCKLVDVYPPIEQTDKRIAIFIGPSGTGKTTTLAKIAGNLSKKGSVGIISLDGKDASNLVLEYYADMFRIPVCRAEDPSDLVKKINSFSDRDFILIDTPGLSPYDKFGKKMLMKNISRLNHGFITYIVLDVTMKDEEILNVIKEFKPIDITALLFTKIDEAKSVGTIFNQMIYTGKPLSYLGTGKSVPDDLEIVTPYRLMELIINQRSESYVEVRKVYSS